MSINQEKHSNQLRLQFKENSKNCLIQIFPNRISVHKTANYDGWEKLFNDFLISWKQLNDVGPGLVAQRIGVRFINKLDEKNIDQELKIWLKPSPYYPETLLSSYSGFFYRGQWSSTKDHGNRLYIVSIAEAETKKEKEKPLMFDIDVVQNCSANDKALISNLASELHEEIWKIFSESISNKYLKVLQKEN